MSNKKVLCIGEVLWDALPSGLYLGGAPLNVCYHLNQLGVDASIASCVGNDRLGKEAIRRIESLGIPANFIQVDKKHETGFVEVNLIEAEPHYTIVEPVAWDLISASNSLTEVVKSCWGVVFGSLAQRHATSRKTIQALWELGAALVFDMNLRHPFIDKEIIHASLQKADIVKVNEDELNSLIDWYSLPANPKSAVEELVDQFDCSAICVTRGANGAMLFYEEDWYEHKGFPVKAKDAVGAGDAFLAALLFGIMNGKSGTETLARANATGSLVAKKDGATPSYSVDEILKEMA